MNLQVIDIVFIVLILLMGFAGFRTGFFSQIITIVGILLGLFVAYFYCDDLSPYVAKVIGEKSFNNLVAFILILAAFLLLTIILSKIFKSALENLGAEGINKLLGFSFGMIQGVFISICITGILTIQPFFDPTPIFQDSIIGTRFLEVLPELEKVLPEGQEILDNLGTEI